MGVLAEALASRRRGGGGGTVALRFSTGEVAECRVASRFLERLRGLILTGPSSPDARGLLLAPCSSVHTFGMSYPLDLVFLDCGGGVVRVCGDVPPGRVVSCPGAYAVLERRAREGPGLPPGGRAARVARVDFRTGKDGEKEKARGGPGAA